MESSMDAADKWHSYNVQKAKNRQRMKERYYKLKKDERTIPPPQKRSRKEVVHVVHKENTSNPIVNPLETGTDLQQEEEEEIELPAETFTSEEDELQQIALNNPESSDMTCLEEEKLLRSLEASIQQRSLVQENTRKINQIIDELDTETAIVCSQAILMLMNSFRSTPEEKTGPVDESYLNVCVECGAFYRIIEIHSCTNSSEEL